MFDIDREHSDYRLMKATWISIATCISAANSCGCTPAQYLVRRQREPGDVFAERLLRVFYENYIGSIIDWYAATLFRCEPALIFEGHNDASKRFFSSLIDDVDRKGTNLTDFCRRQFVEGLVTGVEFRARGFSKIVRDRRKQSRGRCDRLIPRIPGGLSRGRRYQLESR